jgi:hypothetical protein
METNRARVVFAAATMMLGGCAVGTAYVSAPERLPSESLPPLTRPISFDICMPPRMRPHSGIERLRQGTGERMRKALSRAGVRAELTPVAGSPVTFTVTFGGTTEGAGSSLALSVLTYSIVPGYFAERRTLDVDLASGEGGPVEKKEHLQYQARTQLFIWLPLIVHPDVIATLGGGWESAKLKDNGFERTIGRLGDDLRARLGPQVDEPPDNGGLGVSCPEPSAPPQPFTVAAGVRRRGGGY